MRVSKSGLNKHYETAPGVSRNNGERTAMAGAVSTMEAPVLRMESITKTYPGVRALDSVDFEVRAGEAHALVGENGAGKSTLMKVLAGAQARDSGAILIDGKPAHIDSPQAAMELGVSII